jgi:putative transposase
MHFWIRGYNVNTVGLNEEQIRRYIREQENLEKQQMELKFEETYGPF